MNPPAPRWHHGLVLAQFLALLLLGLSYLRIMGDSQSAAFNSHVLDALFAGPIWGTALGYNLLRFALAMVLLHLLYGAACWIMAHLSVRAWPSPKTSLRQHVTIWFILFSVGLLANNAATFTTSSLGEPYADLMTAPLFGVTLGRAILMAVFAAAAVTSLVAVFRWWREGGRPSRRGYAGLGALGIVYLASSAHSILPERASGSAGKPNVILIGLDSLREDLVDERLSPQVTPHVAAFMKNATQFTNAITPLARTFPSMCSMLTGRHPHSSGAVMNLLPRQLIDDSDSLPRVLARAGYRTVYATDEVRFANIDVSYGFTQTITPPIGSSEFLIEKIADAPVFNVLANTRLSAWLFPHVYANRGASRTYDPDSFVRRIDRELEVDQPMFLVTHLTLSHWPYIWAGAPIKVGDKQARWPPYYLRAAERVDQQFADMMDMFERKGLLDDAIVVVYSDHGESFGVHDEALVPDEDPLIHALGVEPIWGHGSTVLTAHQFRIVLGMRRYGQPWPADHKLNAPVTFEDIAPTMVEALGIAAPAHFEGKSLLGLVEGRESAADAFVGRIRFTETEFQMPVGLATQEGKVSASKIEEALTIYTIDRATDRITVKPSHLGQLLLHRQYAAVGDHYLLGAFPRGSEPGFNFLAVTVDGGVPMQLREPPPATERELHGLWSALQAKFPVLRESAQPGAASTVATSTVANSDRTITSSVTK